MEPETTDLTAKQARPFPTPAEPTEQQKAVHNLMRLPYQSWCPVCVRSKRKEKHSKLQKDKQPVIQVDYYFVKTSQDLANVMMLTAEDVQTGLGMAAVTPGKGRDKYCIAEPKKKIIFEIGRTYGIVQYDLEPALKALILDLLQELGGCQREQLQKTGNKRMVPLANFNKTFMDKSELSDSNLRKIQCGSHFG